MTLKEFIEEILREDELNQAKPMSNKVKHFLMVFLFSMICISIMTYGYIEIGHNRGWKRAEIWYMGLHDSHRWIQLP